MKAKTETSEQFYKRMQGMTEEEVLLRFARANLIVAKEKVKEAETKYFKIHGFIP